MIVAKPDLFTYIEGILGAVVYLIGLAGSYYRFGKYERKGKLDAAFLVCIQCGGALLTVSLINVLKYSFVPTLHANIVRALYYSGTLVASTVFFTKNFESGKRSCLLATYFTWGAMAFAFAEALVFYLDLPYGAAIFSCVGLLMFVYFKIPQQPQIVGMLSGIVIMLLPILPKLSGDGLNLDKLNAKREIAVRSLLEKDSLGQEKHNLQEVVDAQPLSGDDRF
jgi:hypothetical protein